jgi:hypothetical protein
MNNDDSCKYLNLMYDAKENDDFKNAKIFKIYEDTYIRMILCILALLKSSSSSFIRPGVF